MLAVKLFSFDGDFAVFSFGQTAHGVIAVGQLARGVIAVGQLAVGVVAVGQLAVSVFGVGMVGVGVAYFAGGGFGASGKCMRLMATPPPVATEPPIASLARVQSGAQRGFARLTLSPSGGESLQWMCEGRPLALRFTPAKYAAILAARARIERDGLWAEIERRGEGLYVRSLRHVGFSAEHRRGLQQAAHVLAPKRPMFLWELVTVTAAALVWAYVFGRFVLLG